MGAGFQPTSGPALDRPSDLAAILTNLEDGDVLFVDEIHRMPRPVEEVLYPALEDFNLDVVLGKGPTARSIRLELPRFTLVGATTRPGRHHASAAGAVRLLAAPGLLLGRGPRQDRDGAPRGSSRCRSTTTRPPRSPGARAAPRGSSTACSGASATSPRSATTARSRGDIARPGLEVFEVDEQGLDRLDHAILQTLIDKFGGGPVGLSTLAASVGEETDTVEDVVEPYLLQLGFLQRTPRGRVATEHAYRHLGASVPGTLPL